MGLPHLYPHTCAFNGSYYNGCAPLNLTGQQTPMSNRELVSLIVAGPSLSSIKKTLASTLWSLWPAGMGCWLPTTTRARRQWGILL